MKLKLLNKAELKQLYETQMRRDFPPAELKPLEAMEKLRDRHAYAPLGLFDGERLVGYAMMWREPGVPLILLDYLAVSEGRRGCGLGTRLLDLLERYCSDCRGILAEVECVSASDPEQAAVQKRRLEFYRRSGFHDAGYDCALFGVHYRTLLRAEAGITAQEILCAHQTIYKTQISGQRYKRFIRIPLAPGEEPDPVGDWTEE